jgi:ankyrin repeat protein
VTGIGPRRRSSIADAGVGFVTLQVRKATIDDSREDEFCQAAQDGDMGEVRTCLAEGLPVDCRNFIAATPLIAAATGGQVDVVEFLLGEGADLRAVNKFGRDAVWNSQSPAMVALLIERGAQIDRPDEDGKTALSHRSWLGKTATIRALIEHGADVDWHDNNGKTCLISAGEGGKPDTARLLLAAGADPDGRDDNGNTALHWAARQGHPRTCAALLDGGVELEAVDSSGRTALVLAASARRERVVKLLLERGARVGDAVRHTRDKAVKQLLHELPAKALDSAARDLFRAASRGDAAAVRAALDGGASPFQQDAEGRDAHSVAMEAQRLGAAAVLRAAQLGEKNEPELLRATVLGDLDRMKATLQASDHATRLRALDLAVEYDRPGVLPALLNTGLAVDDSNAIALASHHGNAPCLERLLLAGGTPLSGSPSQSGAGSECGRLHEEARSGRLLRDATLWGQIKHRAECPICSELEAHMAADLEQGESLPDASNRLHRDGRDRACRMCGTRYRFTREAGWFTTGYETDEYLERM